MAIDTLVFRLQDGEQDTDYASYPINFTAGATLANIQTFSDAAALLLNAVTGSLIVESVLTKRMTLPGGLTGPLATGRNELGGLIQFSTTGPRGASVWIPAILGGIMSGKTFDLAHADIAPLIGMHLNSPANAGGIVVRTEQDYAYSAALLGKKSLRR